MIGYYSYELGVLYKTLFEHLDNRFIALDQINWLAFEIDDGEMLTEEIEDETLKKAAEWARERGYDSIDQLVGHMIFTAETVLGLDVDQLFWRTDGGNISETIEVDGYQIPSITVTGELLKGYGNALYCYSSEGNIKWLKLPAAVSKGCFAAAAGRPFTSAKITVNLITGELTYEF